MAAINVSELALKLQMDTSTVHRTIKQLESDLARIGKNDVKIVDLASMERALKLIDTFDKKAKGLNDYARKNNLFSLPDSKVAEQALDKWFDGFRKRSAEFKKSQAQLMRDNVLSNIATSQKARGDSNFGKHLEAEKETRAYRARRHELPANPVHSEYFGSPAKASAQVFEKNGLTDWEKFLNQYDALVKKEAQIEDARKRIKENNKQRPLSAEEATAQMRERNKAFYTRQDQANRQAIEMLRMNKQFQGFAGNAVQSLKPLNPFGMKATGISSTIAFMNQLDESYKKEKSEQEKLAKKEEKEKLKAEKEQQKNEDKAAQKKEKEEEKRAKESAKKREKFKKFYDKKIKPYADKFNPYHNIADGAKKASGALTRFTKKLKGILLYRTIRALLMMITQGFKEGIKNLYEYSRVIGTDFKKSMDSLSTSALLVKNSVAAFAAPLINELAPIVERLTDGFANLANSVGLFFAKLTDQKSFSWAIRSFKEFNKAKLQLLGFDEINKLNGDENNFTNMFKEVSTQIEEGSFVDQIKKAISKADFTEVGKLLGAKLSEAFNSIDLESIGRNIGEKVDKIVHSMKGFFDGFDAKEAGGKVSAFFNNIMDAVDFKLFGDTLASRKLEILDLIVGFFRDLDWFKVGETISGYVIGFFNRISEWLGEVDWERAGHTIFQKFADLFAGLDLGEVIKSFVNFTWNLIVGAFQGIKSIVSDIASWVAGLDWVELTRAIYDGIWKALKGAWKLVVGALKGVKDILGDVITWMTSLDWAKLRDTLYSSLWKAIKEGFKGIGQAIVDYITKKTKEASGEVNVGEYYGDQWEEELKKNTQGRGVKGSSVTLKVTPRANGGYVDRGDLFIANERGPELIGSVGGKTSVTNQDQFVAAVANAMIPVVDAIYSTGSANVSAIANMPMPSVRIGDRDIFDATQRGARAVGKSLVQGV